MADYYVKVGGNDGLDGLSWPNAWASVNKAATTPVAGDTITFGDGTYNVGAGQIVWNSGGIGNLITFQALNSRQTIWKRSANGQVMDLQTDDDYITFDGIIFDGDETASGWAGSFCIEISSADHITFNDCEIRDTETWGFYVRHHSTHLDFIDCDVHQDHFHDGASHDGYYFWGNGITDVNIIGGSVYDCNHVGVYVDSCDRFLIEETEIYDVHSHCLQFGSPGAGNGWTIDNCEAHLCSIHDSENFGPPDVQYHQLVYITGGDVTAVDIIKCELYNADGSCVQLGNRVTGPFRIDGNTMHNPNAQGHAEQGCVNVWCDVGNPVWSLKNNIFYSTVAAGYTVRIAGNYNANLTADYNLYYAAGAGNTKVRRGGADYATYALYIAGGPYEPNTIIDDNPDFTNLPADDYTLQSVSPAIDEGTDIGEPFYGPAPDIGAHEYEPPVGPFCPMTIVTIRTACAVGAGHQTITTGNLGGRTPKAALFIAVGATDDGVAHDDLNISYGAATSIGEQWVMCTFSENGRDTTDTHRQGTTDACVMFMDDVGAIDGEASFVGFVVNGCTIDWTNAPASAWLLTIVFFTGDSLDAQAATFLLGNQDVETHVNMVGFEPDLLLLGCISRLLSDAPGQHAHFSVGAAANKAGSPQYCYEFRSSNNVDISEVQARISDNYGVMQVNSVAGMDWGCEIGNWDANGFSAWPRDGNSGDDVSYLALAFNDEVDFTVGSITSPVANGNQVIVDPGFEPQFVMVGLTYMAAFDTGYEDASAGAIGLGIFDQFSTAYCNAVADEDNQDISDTQSLSDDQIVNFPQHDGTAGYVATLSSLDANGWTWNFTAQVGAADLWWYVAVACGLPPSPPPPPEEAVTYTLATHTESKELTVNVFTPTIASYIPAGALVGSYAAHIAALRFTISAWLGYDNASITITGPVVEIEDWIARGLGRHIEIYNPALVRIWAGFANAITIGAGPLSQTLGPLMDIGNRVSVMYAPILDATVDPPIVGTTQPTTIAENAASQARYGIIEKVLSGSTSTPDDAERYRDTFVQEHAWPEAGETVTPGGGNEPSVQLDCLGYGAFLNAYAYNTTTTGTTTASIKIQAVLAADPNGLFSTDYSRINTNGYLVPAYENDNAYALSVLQGVVALGDVNDDRWLFGIYDEQRAEYNVVPTDIAYQHRLSDPAQRIETPSGTLVYPWDVRPGRWLFIPDWLTGRAEPSVRRRDLRYVFIESMEYTAPFDLRINGHKIGKLSQVLAKQGLGGTGA